MKYTPILFTFLLITGGSYAIDNVKHKTSEHLTKKAKTTNLNIEKSAVKNILRVVEIRLADQFKHFGVPSFSNPIQLTEIRLANDLNDKGLQISEIRLADELNKKSIQLAAVTPNDLFNP